MRAFIITVISIFLILILTIVGIIFYEGKFHSKYKKTKINMSYQTIINNWGKPEKVIINKDGSKSIFYYSLIDEYVFNINNVGMVELKYCESCPY